MRTLALDIGNTAVKAGCFEDSALREMAAGLTAAEVRALVQRWSPQHVVVASVAEAVVGGRGWRRQVHLPLDRFD